MPETAEYLLAQACLCRRFADEVRSNKTANGLRDLAHEYDARQNGSSPSASRMNCARNPKSGRPLGLSPQLERWTISVAGQRIVAVGLLTRRDVDMLGNTFDRLWPVDETPCSASLLQAIDEADREMIQSRLPAMDD